MTKPARDFSWRKDHRRAGDGRRGSETDSAGHRGHGEPAESAELEPAQPVNRASA